MYKLPSTQSNDLTSLDFRKSQGHVLAFSADLLQLSSK